MLFFYLKWIKMHLAQANAASSWLSLPNVILQNSENTSFERETASLYILLTRYVEPMTEPFVYILTIGL